MSDQQSEFCADRRRYLSSVEQRLHKLEGLFAELLPDVDLEGMLASSSTSSKTPATLSERVTPTMRRTAPTQEGEDTFSEALPDDPDGFDWREETTDENDFADGMASLSIDPTGAGYLGLSWVQVSQPS